MAFTKEQMAENIKRLRSCLVPYIEMGLTDCWILSARVIFTRLRHPPDFTVPVRADFCTTHSRFMTACRGKSQRHRYCGLIPCRIQRMKA